MELAQNIDRIRKTSTDDEENVSIDEESSDVVETDHEPSLSHQLSMESLIECLKNAAEIESEHGKLGENDKDQQDNVVKVSPINDVELTKETPEGSLKNDKEDEKKEQKASAKQKSKIQKKNSFWKRKGSSKVVP